MADRFMPGVPLPEVARRLQEAQRLAQLGSWELDLTTDTLVWSDEIYRIFEIDPAKFGATYQAFLDSLLSYSPNLGQISR